MFVNYYSLQLSWADLGRVPHPSGDELTLDKSCLVAVGGSVYLLGAKNGTGSSSFGLRFSPRSLEWEEFTLGVDIGGSVSCAVEADDKGRRHPVIWMAAEGER